MKIFLLSVFVIIAIALHPVFGQCDGVSIAKFVAIGGVELSNLNPYTVPWNRIDSIVNSTYYDNNKKTIVYAFGYRDSYEGEAAQAIIKAFMTRRREYNIFIIDWGSFNQGNYVLKVIPNLLKVGEFFGKRLLEMRGLGFNLDKFHLVGHSLGAHLVGQIGRTTKNSVHKYVFHRITGLDPAGPVFFPLNSFVPALSALDAEYVDIIHTDSMGVGANTGTGHADFWPNSGATQPGCTPVNYLSLFEAKSICSHIRAWQYYVESVTRNAAATGFQASKCNSWNDFTRNLCTRLQPTGDPFSMGFYTNPSMKGNFYLQTNAQAPFSKDTA